MNVLRTYFISSCLLCLLLFSISFKVAPSVKKFKSPQWSLSRLATRKIESETVATGLVYFVQGSLTLSRLATSFFLKDELHLSAAEISYLTGITSVPWALKPLYGLISDNIPLFGSRRRSYLILSSVLGIISWLDLSLWVHSALHAAVAISCSSLSIAVSDVIIDSLVIERTQRESLSCGKNFVENKVPSAGNLQTLCWGASSAGSLVSSYLGITALPTLRPQEIFLATSILPLTVAISATLIEETKLTNKTFEQPLVALISSKVGEIWTFLKSPTIFLPLTFLILWRITPNTETVMFYFYVNELLFSETFIAKLQFYGSLSSFAGILIYRNFVAPRLTTSEDKASTSNERRISITMFIRLTLLFSVPVSMLQIILTNGWNQHFLNLSNEWFAAVDAMALNVFEEISFMPIMTLASVICPAGFEGSLFASIMSIFNLAGILSNELSAVLMDRLDIADHNFNNLSLYVAICATSSLLPLMLARFLLKRLDSASH